MGTLKILHTEIEKDFLDHLAMPGNSRIFFSGPFGSGKSTFLSELMESNENYVFLKLFPINYSVLQNDDVFELIKLDLILELLTNFHEEIALEVHEFPVLLSAQMFITEKIRASSTLNFFTNLLPNLAEADEDLQDVGAIAGIAAKLNKSAKSLLAEYKSFKEKIGKAGEYKLLQDFQVQQETRLRKSESDAVSSLIRDLIGRVKKKKSRGESILVIDDLDRLDPEHIFRLFNIFSAHYDVKDDSNRFGFDKVVFVCDLENIRQIYHHRYGQGVDFGGYIHKFYSLIPFDFDNRKFIVQKVSEILRKLQFKIPANKSNFSLQDEGSNFYIFCQFMLLSLINSRRLSLRRLTNYGEYIVPKQKIKPDNYRQQTNFEFKILILFQFIKSIFGSWSAVSSELNFLAKYYNNEAFSIIFEYSNIDPDWLKRKIISECLPFLVEKNILEEIKESAEYSQVLGHTLYWIESYGGVEFSRSTRGTSDQPIILNPFVVLQKTFDECLARHILG